MNNIEETKREKKAVPPGVSKYMKKLGKMGGKSNADKLKSEGLMDERIKKMTEASLATRARNKLIKQLQTELNVS